MRRPKGKGLLIGGGTVGLLVLGATVFKKRYTTGEAKILKLIELEDGSSIVVLDNEVVFWANATERAALMRYSGDSAKPLPYRIDNLRHTPGGVAIGTVNTED